MALQIGNREKLAGLSIVGLATIGLMHYLLFMDKAHSYNAALKRYQAERARYIQTVTPEQKPQIVKFMAANEAMELFVYDLMSNLGVDWPDIFFPEEGEEAVRKRQARFLELVEKTTRLRTEHPKLELPFLDWGDGEGWDIPAALPVSAMPPVLWDHVDALKNTAATIEALSDPIQKAYVRNNQYNPQLLLIGVDASRLQPQVPAGLPPRPGFRSPFPLIPTKTVANHGPLVPLIKKLAHARLIWEQKVQEEKGGGGERIPIQTKDELYKLLEIELPDNKELLFYAIKQLEFLHKLIAIAEAEGVEEVRAVKLMPVKKVDDIPADPTNPAKHLMVPEFYPSAQFGYRGSGTWTRGAPTNPYAPRPRPDYTPEDDDDYAPTRGVPPGPPGVGPAGAVPPEEEYDPLKEAVIPPSIPIPGGDWVGDVTPIQIAVFATWETTLKFLYTVHHNYNPFEIDSLLMKTRPGEGGRITTAVTLVPMANLKGLKGFFAPATTQPLAAATPGPAGPPIGGGVGRP